MTTTLDGWRAAVEGLEILRRNPSPEVRTLQEIHAGGQGL